MLSNGYFVCPKCGKDTTFTTSAHVAQTWEVDNKGNFIDCIEDCTDVIANPDVGNIWSCTKCGAEGVFVSDV